MTGASRGPTRYSLAGCVGRVTLSGAWSAAGEGALLQRLLGQPAIKAVVLDAPLAVGSTRQIHNADGTVLTERITVLDPPFRHAYELTGFSAPFSWLVRLGDADWTLQATEAGTLVRWRYDFSLTSRSAGSAPETATLPSKIMKGTPDTPT